MADRFLVQLPPSRLLTTPQMDEIYELPFTRQQHPMYNEPVPALFEVQFSITAMRGCPGMCSFCSISAHQGKKIQKRSKKSIVEEAKRLAAMDDFKGNISDVGGPTANFYDAVCTAKNSQSCTRNCMTPQICNNLKVSHKGITEVLEGVEKVPGIKRVFIRSGLRYDYIMADKDKHFFQQTGKETRFRTAQGSARARLPGCSCAYEQTGATRYMSFAQRFTSASRNIGKKQYILPYYISSHPGSTLEDAIELAQTLKKQRFIPEQVQDFYPTPGTLIYKHVLYTDQPA